MIEIYRDTARIKSSSDRPPYCLIQEIDRLLQVCADRAYNKSALDCSRRKQEMWFHDIVTCERGGRPIFVNAHYGSAVEEMVNQQLTISYARRQRGYRVELQVRHGSTIPDIVILDRNNREVAWLDITSEGEAGHIWDKDGIGWFTVDFVAELLYPNFNMLNLRRSDGDGIGAYAHMRSLARKGAIYDRNLQQYLERKMNIALREFDANPPESRHMVSVVMEGAFDYEFQHKKKHPAIKSMLKKYLEYFPDSIYCELIRELLRHYYKGIGQDLIRAMRFLADSYYKEEKENTPYVFDFSDDFLP